MYERSQLARGRDWWGLRTGVVYIHRLGGGKGKSSRAEMAPPLCSSPVTKVLLCSFKENRLKQRESLCQLFVSCL